MAKRKKTQAKTGEVKKVVLAYSGGLDTSVILPWLRENYGCEVICYAADLGQGVELEGVREKAKACGAKRIVVEDLRKAFVEDYLWSTGANYWHVADGAPDRPRAPGAVSTTASSTKGGAAILSGLLLTKVMSTSIPSLRYSATPSSRPSGRLIWSYVSMSMK